jgi:hypothetical protein
MKIARDVGAQRHDRLTRRRGKDERLRLEVTAARNEEMDVDLVALAVDNGLRARFETAVTLRRAAQNGYREGFGRNSTAMTRLTLASGFHVT